MHIDIVLAFSRVSVRIEESRLGDRKPGYVFMVFFWRIDGVVPDMSLFRGDMFAMC